MHDVLIIHRDFRYIGGAERISLAFIKYFKKLINNIDIYILTKNISREFFGVLRAFNIHRLNLYTINVGKTILNKTIYSSLEDAFLFKSVKRRYSSRQEKSTIVVNTKFNEIPVGADICYIHYPMCIVLKKNPYEPSLLGPVLGRDYMSSRFLYTYMKTFAEICYDITIREILDCKAVLFNSSLTLHIFERYVDPAHLSVLKKRLYVVHPPIISNLKNNTCAEKPYDKTYVVIRFKPLSFCPPECWSKTIVEIARTFKDVNIVVMGFAKSITEALYIEMLRKLVKEQNISNIHILLNVPEEVKNFILLRAKVYVHLVPYEHFGIMPLEALLSGANVVVHERSGFSLDTKLGEPHIIRYRKYPFELEELLTAISVGYYSESPNFDIVRQVSEQYSFNAFEMNISKILDDIGIGRYS